MATQSSEALRLHLRDLVRRNDFSAIETILLTNEPPVEQHVLNNVLRYSCTGANSKEDVKIIDLLLMFGAEVTAKIADHARFSNNPYLLQTLIAHGWDINTVDSRDKTALSGTLGVSVNTALTKWLVERGAIINHPEMTGFQSHMYTAAIHAPRELLQLCLAVGGHPEPNTILLVFDNPDLDEVLMRKLMEYGVNVNSCSIPTLPYRLEITTSAFEIRNSRPYNSTPLHYAIRRHRNVARNVKLLIDLGADINKVVDGQKPIELAKTCGHRNIVDLLTEAREREEREKEAVSSEMDVKLKRLKKKIWSLGKIGEERERRWTYPRGNGIKWTRG